jgi:hypothetical protein
MRSKLRALRAASDPCPAYAAEQDGGLLTRAELELILLGLTRVKTMDELRGLCLIASRDLGTEMQMARDAARSREARQ